MSDNANFRGRKGLTVAERFWPKVDRTGDGCWEWRGAGRTGDYGRFRVGLRVEVAHRVAWLLTNGPIPDGLDVLHRCDNPPCVNPAHLFLGTDKDNMRDMLEKGRNGQVGVRGEAHYNHKLTDADVRAIRLSDVTDEELGQRYGVSGAHISRIRVGDARRDAGGPLRPRRPYTRKVQA